MPPVPAANNATETYVNVNVPVNVHDLELSTIDTSQFGPELCGPIRDVSVVATSRSFTFTGTFTFT